MRIRTRPHLNDFTSSTSRRNREIRIENPNRRGMALIAQVRPFLSEARYLHKADKSSASMNMHSHPHNHKMAITPTQLSIALTTSGLPTPSPHFLTTILSSQRTQPPLPALVATAKHRLLSSDISVCARRPRSNHALLPSGHLLPASPRAETASLDPSPDYWGRRSK